MTRRRLTAHLTGTFLLLGLVLGIAAASRFAYPLAEPGGELQRLLQALYEYLRDMSLLIATGGVAYLTNVYQKRSSFLAALREEWREIVEAKAALLAYTHLASPGKADYMAAFNRISQTIDNMRTVYRNVGETEALVGLYPYAPLHDMRRAFQTLNPSKSAEVSEEARKLVRDAMLQSFYALRECFLEELDLEEPVNPLLIYAGRRHKASGAARRAIRAQERQRRRQDRAEAPDPRIDELLARLHDKEASTPRAWRKVSGQGEEPAGPAREPSAAPAAGQAETPAS